MQIVAPAANIRRMNENKYNVQVRSTGLPGEVTRGYTFVMWALCLLFALRVAGQALQLWLPQPFLPPFHAFQGSNLPYWLLLTAQLAILAVMARLAWRMQMGTLLPRRRLARALAWTGGIYMTGSLARLMIGVAVPAAPSWFTAWISGFFHLVLAAFVLALAAYHGQDRRFPLRQEESK